MGFEDKMRLEVYWLVQGRFDGGRKGKVFGWVKECRVQGICTGQKRKYMKTIVAFANTQGGRLFIGIDDRTREVVGVDNMELFQIMDSIANAVSDLCEPQIIPDIEPQTVDGKNIIVVTVEAGKNRPYYLKSKGLILFIRRIKITDILSFPPALLADCTSFFDMLLPSLFAFRLMILLILFDDNSSYSPSEHIRK